MKNSIMIIGEQKLTAGQKRYWLSDKFLVRMEKMGVNVVDPSRMPLKELRQCISGATCYRASTGGKYGKSASLVRL